MKINRTAIILDQGLFQPLAHRLARDYDRVLYFRPWVSSFPHAKEYYIGSGYPRVERVESYEEYFDEENVTWVFPDLHFAPLQKWLRSKGRAVWGAGNGEELELMRAETKELLKEIGLPAKPWAVVEGMESLRTHLEKHENVFVKISALRGISETFCSPSYELVKPKLDEIEHELGPLADTQEFVIETPVETDVEVGYDGWNIDGEFPKTALVGVEKKDACYFGQMKPYASLPEGVREVNRKLAPIMKGYGYRGFFSTEIRVGKDKKPYLIDITARHASPAGESILELVENISEIIEAGAHGKLVEIKPKAKYVAQAMLCSDFAQKNWLPVSIPDEIREHVHLYHSCRAGELEYVVPMDLDMSQIGSVTAAGATPEAAIKLCKEYADQIEAFGLKDSCDKLGEAAQELAKA